MNNSHGTISEGVSILRTTKHLPSCTKTLSQKIHPSNAEAGGMAAKYEILIGMTGTTNGDQSSLNI